MKFKFLSLFVALSIFAMGTNVMAVAEKEQEVNKVENVGDWQGNFEKIKGLIIALFPLMTQQIPNLDEDGPDCKNIVSTDKTTIFPSCLVSCLDELLQSKITMPDKVQQAVGAIKGLQATFCGTMCIGSQCKSTPLLAKTCGVLCCPFTATAFSAGQCLKQANLGTGWTKCGDTYAPKTCPDPTALRKGI